MILMLALLCLGQGAGGSSRIGRRAFLFRGGTSGSGDVFAGSMSGRAASRLILSG